MAALTQSLDLPNSSPATASLIPQTREGGDPEFKKIILILNIFHILPIEYLALNVLRGVKESFLDGTAPPGVQRS
jgi:hypothetical protein